MAAKGFIWLWPEGIGAGGFGMSGVLSGMAEAKGLWNCGTEDLLSPTDDLDRSLLTTMISEAYIGT